jgi:hypothetical protein
MKAHALLAVRSDVDRKLLLMKYTLIYIIYLIFMPSMLVDSLGNLKRQKNDFGKLLMEFSIDSEKHIAILLCQVVSQKEEHRTEN